MGLLHTLTAIEQWRYVAGELKPADIASRGKSEKIKCADIWFDGQSFLRNKAEWPAQPVFAAEITEDNPKRCCSQQVEVKTGMFKLFAQHSSLNKLQSAVAWILRFKTCLKMKYGNKSKQVVKGPLSVCELDCALLSIYRRVQQQALPKIFTVLPNHGDSTGSRETVFKRDLKRFDELRRLQALSPFMVGGILRLDGRLRWPKP